MFVCQWKYFSDIKSKFFGEWSELVEGVKGNMKEWREDWEEKFPKQVTEKGGVGEKCGIILFVRCDLFWCEILNERWEDTDKVGCPQRELRKRTRQMTLRKYIVLWNVTCNTARLPTWFTCKFYPDHLEHFPLVHLHLESGPPTLLEASEPPGLWLSWPAWLWWWLTTSDGLLQHFLLGSSRQLKILRGVLAFQCKLLFIIINMNITIIIPIPHGDHDRFWWQTQELSGPQWTLLANFTSSSQDQHWNSEVDDLLICF